MGKGDTFKSQQIQHENWLNARIMYRETRYDSGLEEKVEGDTTDPWLMNYPSKETWIV
jgi:hypothetical protein